MDKIHDELFESSSCGPHSRVPHFSLCQKIRTQECTYLNNDNNSSDSNDNSGSRGDVTIMVMVMMIMMMLRGCGDDGDDFDGIVIRR